MTLPCRLSGHSPLHGAAGIVVGSHRRRGRPKPRRSSAALSPLSSCRPIWRHPPSAGPGHRAPNVPGSIPAQGPAIERFWPAECCDLSRAPLFQVLFNSHFFLGRTCLRSKLTLSEFPLTVDRPVRPECGHPFRPLARDSRSSSTTTQTHSPKAPSPDAQQLPRLARGHRRRPVQGIDSLPVLTPVERHRCSCNGTPHTRIDRSNACMRCSSIKSSAAPKDSRPFRKSVSHLCRAECPASRLARHLRQRGVNRKPLSPSPPRSLDLRSVCSPSSSWRSILALDPNSRAAPGVHGTTVGCALATRTEPLPPLRQTSAVRSGLHPSG